jgi:stearoyl-CoA desaturase (delta-9 desaturase)
LHNNHHADPASPKLSVKKWEWDLGWTYIKLLERYKLATLREQSV